MNAKILRLLFQLTVPGGILLLVSALLMRAAFVPDSVQPFLQYYPYVVFGIGLLLSAIFNRSRLFFTLLLLGLSDRLLARVVPRLAETGMDRALFDAIALLLPLNLLAFSFMRDRGIITSAGRRRMALIVVQVIAVGLISFHGKAHAATIMNHVFVPRRFSDWSHISQPALLAFVVAALAMLYLLLWRRRPVESGLFWTLVAAFLALNVGVSTQISSTYFATGGLILVIAVLETSYAMAYRDELTQLPSRRSFNESLLKLGDSYTVAMVDVDRFKQFNDNHGHATGDQVLQMIAAKLANVSGGGRAFRYGGEEFAVLFSGKSVDQSFPYLEQLRKSVEQTRFAVRGRDRRKKRLRGFRKSKKQTQVTVSIGVAAPNGERIPPEQVVHAADKALYRAKANGRNCTVASEIVSRDGNLSVE